MMRKRASGTLAVKDRGDGAVSDGTLEAVFATFGVKDHDGDVIVAGAISDNAPVVISGWNHASWQPGAMPIGRGRIKVAGNQARVVGRLFMDSETGREAHAILKELGELAEFSWSLHEVESHQGQHNGERVNFITKVRVHEVSPVLKAASVGTGTMSLRSLDPALAEALGHVAEYDHRRAVEREVLRYTATNLGES